MMKSISRMVPFLLYAIVKSIVPDCRFIYALVRQGPAHRSPQYGKECVETDPTADVGPGAWHLVPGVGLCTIFQIECRLLQINCLPFS